MTEEGVGWPTSTKDIDKLGDALRENHPPTAEMLRRLQRLRDLHEAALRRIQTDIEQKLGTRASSRLKTTGTIVEKLRRQPTMRLSRMQDIAGLRIVRQMTLADQDRLVARICECRPLKARVIDRREHPSFGYRAVHVVLHDDGRPIEIQVRTGLQDVWAQLMERFAGVWGRQIQYGDPPTDPEARGLAPPAGPVSRASLIVGMGQLSEAMGFLETWTSKHSEVSHEIAEIRLALPKIPDGEREELNARLSRLEAGLVRENRDLVAYERNVLSALNSVSSAVPC